MTATDRIRGILATLDADIAALTRLRALVAAALEPEPESEPGNSSGPVPVLRLAPDPKPATPVRKPRSKYMRPILAALKDGPLTGSQIGQCIRASETLWWSTFRGCAWFERANSTQEYPALWRLSEAGRAALAAATDSAPSADTATGATSTGPADSAGTATTRPA